MSGFRFGLVTLGILLSSAVLQIWLPWWSMVAAALLWGYGVPLRSPTRSLWAGFLAGALLWGGYAFYIQQVNEGLLAERVGAMLGGVPGAALPLLSGLFAGILSGLGALTGRQARGLADRNG